MASGPVRVPDLETTCAWLRALAAANGWLKNLADMIDSGSIQDPAGVAKWLRALAVSNAWCATLADLMEQESTIAQEIIDAARAALESIPPGPIRERLAAGLTLLDSTIGD
jgi:hypothetical protein